MQINSNPLTLFDFIGNQEKTNEVLENLAERSKKDVVSGLQAFETGLNLNEFEETLKQIENGEISVDLPTIENYFSFNQNKLESALSSLQRNFDLEPPLEVTVEDGGLQVSEHEDQDRIQRYLDRDESLNKLITQTSKLSQFVEWAQAKEQAATFKEEGMSESELVDFLKSARTVVTETNRLYVSNEASLFDSEDQTKGLIDKYTVKKEVVN